MAANDSALPLGIQLGAPVAAAEALASGLLVVAQNTNNEAHALERVAAWALQFTPSDYLPIVSNHVRLIRNALPVR